MRSEVITFQVAQPAAGVDFSFVPSQTDQTLLLAVTGKLVTGANAANRRPALAIKDKSGLYVWSADAGYPQVASLTTYYSWARGASVGPDTTIAASERVSLPLPWLRLQPGDIVASITGLIDAADQWSAVVWRGIVGEWWEEETELANLARAFAVATSG